MRCMFHNCPRRATRRLGFTWPAPVRADACRHNRNELRRRGWAADTEQAVNHEPRRLPELEREADRPSIEPKIP